ncbi:hypothetical protein A3C89_02620 [Candidatus Kaiserbacteria bacterium RIFCSPHIGHO2_02_FULL_50_50]|uniref:Uncharacterized protein n=1 Tax=Candidatus Kaiserbacteria bacterium RIFCSPHIGHO2_02_FULL_50_50 TaxID=1798492 RepID=A0A1F6DD73_9BACT|nr:MAG: hypothetical protein A3C89_02620 [Candidatus Kaiserbacteria bacterium RIFCSPHIGHO2_02_FULL_50_50]OGG88007.1 MAG: hypothetical protein A3G62_03635 [Candidatus Kaiserbacteria bacterium RIFCSPLOWO2_12_FULL_50_10]
MSRHYLVLTQKTLGASRVDMEALALELAKVNPAQAAVLRSLDFVALKKHAAKKAFDDAVRMLGIEGAAQYVNSDQWDTVSGVPEGADVIGVFKKGSVQLGICIDAHGSLASFANRYHHDNSDRAAWEEAFETQYRNHAVAMTLSIVAPGGGTVTQETLPDGVTVTQLRF